MCREIAVSTLDESLQDFLRTSDRDLELLMGYTDRLSRMDTPKSRRITAEQNPPINTTPLRRKSIR